MGKFFIMFPLTWESFAFWHSSWICLGILQFFAPILIPLIFQKCWANHITPLLTSCWFCPNICGLEPRLLGMVCYAIHTVCPVHLPKCTYRHFSNTSSTPAAQTTCCSPKGHACFRILVFVQAVPSVENALPYLITWQKHWNDSPSLGPPSFLHPTTWNLFFLARDPRSTSQLSHRRHECQATRNLRCFHIYLRTWVNKLIAINAFLIESPSSPASPRIPQSWIQCHADLHLLCKWRQAGEQGELCGRENIRE